MVWDISTQQERQYSGFKTDIGILTYPDIFYHGSIMQGNSLFEVRSIEVPQNRETRTFLQEHAQCLQIFVLNRHVNAVLHVHITRLNVRSSLKKKSSTLGLASCYSFQERCAVLCIA